MDETLNAMKTIGCKEVKKRIDGYARMTGASGHDPALEAHVANCPACMKEYRETREILSLLAQDRLPEPRPEFWNGLSRQIMAQVGPCRPEPREIPWFKKIWGAPFGWPGYAWVTAVILVLLTPLAIYTIQDRSQAPPSPQGFSGNELRWELGLESFPSVFETLSPGESARLGERLVARIGQDLSRPRSLAVEEDYSWDFSRSLEGLNGQEMDGLIEKLQPGGSAGFNEVKHYVS